MEQQVFAWIAQYGYAAIFVLLVFGIVGLPVPDETLLTFTGYMVFKGHLRLPLAFGAALAGSLSGITVSFTLGRLFGLALVHRHGRYLRITEAHIARAHAWFERVGRWGLTFGYFIPGVRHITAYAAGMSELEPRHFALYAYPGGFAWVASFIGLGYFLGDRWQDVLKLVERYLLGGSIALGVLIAGYLAWRKWGRGRGIHP
jgi:membrane protein DedA with SNARE-associated domain